MLHGVIPAMITPLKHGGQKVDYEVLENYCEFLIGKDVNAVFVCGSTGEGPLLSLQERKDVAQTVIASIKNRIKVIIQAGYISTSGTIDLLKHAQESGADGAGVVLPYYYPLDEKALLNHFLHIAGAVPDFSLYLYNIPQFTNNNLTGRLLSKIVTAAPNVCGIKTSNSDLFQLQEYIQILGSEKAVLFGCDRLDLAALALGANGIISGNASAFPEPFLKLWNLFRSGDLDKAQEQFDFNSKLALVLKDGLFPAIYKKSLELRGIPAGDVRSPHRELTSEEVRQLKKSLQEMDLI